MTNKERFEKAVKAAKEKRYANNSNNSTNNTAENGNISDELKRAILKQTGIKNYVKFLKQTGRKNYAKKYYAKYFKDYKA